LPLIIGTLPDGLRASSLYLVLKVGLTVSASIPVGAVISIRSFAFFPNSVCAIRLCSEKQHRADRRLSRRINRLRLGVTMPAIMILGFDLESTRVMLVAILAD